MKIRTKLLGMAVIPFILIAILVADTMNNYLKMEQEAMYREKLSLMKSNTYRRYDIAGKIVSGAASEAEKKELADLIESFDKTILELQGKDEKSKIKMSRFAKINKELDGIGENWNKTLKPAYNSVLASGDSASMEVLTKEIEGFFRKLETISIDYASMANSKIKSSIIINILIVIIGIFIIGIYTVLIKKSVIDPIEKLKNKMDEISSGDADLSKKIELQSDDEIGEVAKGFNKFIDNMERVILKINETSEKVAKTSIELSKNIKQVVEGEKTGNSDKNMVILMENMKRIMDNVTNQTSASEEVSATITEVSHSINTVAKNSEETMKLSTDTANYAKLGGVAVEDSLRGMKNIENTVRNIEAKTLKLGESSEQISDIVSMITKIASQTNLLSLNAAIEAARAGELGKGFAVVAEEVRKLAESSHSATAEIATLVSVIQNEVREVIQTVKSGYEEVQKGTKLSEETKEKIEKIIERVEMTNSEVARISSSIEEQATAIDEINIATENIAHSSTNIGELSVDQTTAMEDIVSILKNVVQFSSELSEVSDAMKNMVKQFKVDKNRKIEKDELIKWSKDFSVGIDHFDDEHKVLISLINQLNDAMLDGKSKSVVDKILIELLNYTEFHFRKEEKEMKDINYPGLDEQIRMHKMFVDKIRSFKDEFESGEALMSVKIIDFLKDWLLSHIIKVDKKYKDYFNEHGIY